MNSNNEIVQALLEKALKYVENVEQFANGQVPLFVQELMEFKVVEHLVDGVSSIFAGGAILGTIMCGITFLISSELFRGYIRQSHKDKLKVYCATALFTYLIAFTTSTGISTQHFIKAYKAKYAPRVYLVEYFRNKVKN
jgi:hypothetical protein